MKTSSSFLHDLIHQLTKAEKRYVKIRAGSNSKQYLQLFEALLAQKNFDEQELLHNHQGAPFIKNLAVNKRYLYEFLLQSLTQFGQQSIEDRVLEKMAATKVLLKKGMIKAATSELTKGQKLATQYELFELQLMLSNIQKQLIGLRPLRTRQEAEIKQIFSLEKTGLTQLQNTHEYWWLAQQITQFQMQYQKTQTEEQEQHFEQLGKSPLLQDVELATNFRSKLYYYQAKATWQFVRGRVREAYLTNAEFLDFLEAHPRFLQIYAERYLATLNNMLIDSLINKDFAALESGIERLDQTLEKPAFKSIKNIEARVFRQRYLLLINWSLSDQNFTKALEWIPEIERGLAQFGQQIEKHHRITFYYLIAYLLFLNAHYDQALLWNNRILNDPKENVVKEIFYFARVLNVLLHFELHHFNLVESLLLSTPRYLKARRTLYATEKALFSFMHKCLSTVTHAEQKALIRDFTEEVHALSQIATEQRVFNYLDLRLWVRTREK